MAAPALRIPVELDTEALKRQLEKGANHVSEATRAMRAGFDAVNKAMLGAAGGAVVAGVLRTVTVVGGAVVAFKALQGVISGTREELARMVEIFNRARDAGVSAEFWQSFIAGAKGAADMVAVFEGALDHARRATTARLDVTAGSILDAEDLKTQWSEVEQAIQRAKVLLQGGGLGPQQFGTATNQDERNRAALQTMSELLRAGEKLEALNLGEKMFGRTFVDNIRNGKIEVDKLGATIDRLLAGKASGELFGEKIIGNETVRQAKELDERLTEAWRLTEQNLKPAWGVLGNLALDIKNAWVIIVELIEKATSLIPNIAAAMRTMDFERLTRQRGEIAQQLLTGTSLSAQRVKQLGNQLDRVDEMLTALAPPGTQVTVRPKFSPFTIGQIRGALGGATPRDAATTAAGATAVDPFQTAIDALNKRTQGIEAETKAIDDGTAAREKSRVAAQLEAVAKDKNGEVTEANRIAIERFATAYGNAVAKMEQARAPLANLARESANLGKQMNEFGATSLNSFTSELANVITGATKAQDAFKKLADSIINDLVRIALKRAIIGPIAGQLNALFPVTGAAGGPGPIFAPGMMAGGPVAAGQPYVVGERGPELFVPGSMGRIVPNGGGGGVTQTVVINDYSGHAQVSQKQSAEGGGIEVFVPALEQMLASGVSRGRGSLSKSMDARRRGTNLYG
jgi:hypothetical protein